MTTKNKSLVFLCSIVFSLTLAFGYWIYFKNICVRDFPKPVLNEAELNNKNIEEVGQRIAEKWLEFYKSKKSCDLDSWLGDYRVTSVRTQPPKEDVYTFGISYSVEPFLFVDNWVAGNGIVEGRWVKNKHTFIKVVKEGGQYRWLDRANMF